MARGGHLPALFAAAVSLAATLALALAPPPAGARGPLALVVSLCRHGDRSPLYSWPSDLLALSAWPDGPGQLTAVGVRAHYDLGAALRRHYVDDLNFLSGTYSAREVHVRSTSIDRTLMSAYAQLAGLFPPGTASLADVRTRFGGPPLPPAAGALPGRAQAVPIRTVPRTADGLLIAGAACARHTALRAEKRRARAWRAHEAAAAPLLANLTRAAGAARPLALGDAFAVADTWVVQRAHDVPLPDGGEALLGPALRLAEWTANDSNAGAEARRLRAGLLLHEVAKRARVAAAAAAGGALGPAQAALHRPFVVLSAHDTTVAAALAALGAFSGVNPPYNSTLIWEVYAAPPGAPHPVADASVRVLYNRVPLRLPACAGRPACSLAQYLAGTAPVTVSGKAQRRRECLTGAARAGADIAALFVHDAYDADDLRPPRPAGKWPAWTGLGVALLALLAAAAACRRRYARDRTHMWIPVDGHEDAPQRAPPKTFGEANLQRAILI